MQLRGVATPMISANKPYYHHIWHYSYFVFKIKPLSSIYFLSKIFAKIANNILDYRR